MDRLIYTSLSAMRGAMARQAATANNLANVNTAGFRGEIAAAQALWVTGGEIQPRALASEQVLGADMREGAVTETGRSLDIAIDGDALLAVQAPNGDEGYTRRGDLQLSDSGLLTTGDGNPVQGDQGPIALPPADNVKIDRDGSIWVVPLGGDPNQPQLIDRLKLASPAGSAIVKGLDGLFRVEGGGALPADPQARVTSGSLEGSNVETTSALVEMIEASRAWETQMKLISAAREIDTASADLMRLD
ncbi:flagellar basal-body rod protein FlgF [Allosphingosinicella flava]|uniref:Flagellar basal-body rod protein FlgF n=1 Tax=Allosphingosinicella flava TaxID=2771430 RepID=A0A7T2GK38_9SPHN|nr:flagellar basal-body rod protein FlgF [Sphingosinicella flava]QPQ55335.1 flagellar basal-body rod protein FlgF [Sphingosinicella flava]